MINHACTQEEAINAVYASQQIDMSVRTIKLTDSNAVIPVQASLEVVGIKSDPKSSNYCSYGVLGCIFRDAKEACHCVVVCL